MKCAVPDRFDLCDPADGFSIDLLTAQAGMCAQAPPAAVAVRHGCRGSQAT